MSTEEKSSDGIASEDTSSVNPVKKDSVSAETHNILLKQRKKDREKMAQLEAELEQLRANKEREEELKLKEQGQFKELVGVREKRIKELEEQLNSEKKEKDEIKDDLYDYFKLNAFYSKLPGKIKKKEYLKYVDLSSIIYNPETREVDEQSVDNCVNDFMESFGSDLVDISGFKSLPGDAPRTTGKLTAAELRKLPLKERKEKLKDLS